MIVRRFIIAAVIQGLAVCLVPRTAKAQLVPGLRITESNPSNGSVSVPKNSQVTLTFSAPLDASTTYSSGLPIELLDPNGDIASRIGSYTTSLDQLSLTLNISNPIDSDISLVVTAARGMDGDYLCTPYALNYTTRPNGGAFTVSGDAHWGLTKMGAANCNYGPPLVIAALFDAPHEQGGKIVSAGVSQDFRYSISPERTGRIFSLILTSTEKSVRRLAYRMM